MTVPASGQLSLQGLYNEVDDSTYPGSGSNTDVSLKNISTGANPPGKAINTASSSRPDGTAPHAMSEFYGYDQSAAAAGYTLYYCLLYTSPSPRDVEESRMPSSA